MPRAFPSMPRPKILTSVSVPGYRHFVTPLRKLIFDYAAYHPAQDGIRQYIKRSLVEMARENPDVEVVVRTTKRATALLRGHYVNGRDKVICVNTMTHNEIKNKVDLLLFSSGAKIKPLKNLTLEAGPGAQSARGIWSALHDQAKPGGGYTI